MSCSIFSTCSQYSMGTFLQVQLEYAGSVCILWVLGMFPMVSNEQGKVFFKEMISWGTTVVKVAV